MRCVKYDRANCRVLFTTERIPKVEKDDEVVVRVILAGVCGTDLHILENKYDAVDGVILGHEIVGCIHESPATCDKFKVGERVALNPNFNCGQCQACKKGLYNFCEEAGLKTTLGIGQNGGWAQFCKAHTSLVFKLSDDITYEQAVLCEPLSCIIHAVDRLKNIKIGSNIMILGAGIIGLLWCNLLHLFGHRQLLVSEPNVIRQKTVENLNLGIKCMSWDKVLVHKKNSPEWNVDLCIDCSGKTEAIQAAVDLLQYGSTLLIFGVSDPAETIEVSPYLMYKKELTLTSANTNTHISFQKAVAIMESLNHKYITAEKMAMKKFKLKDCNAALETFKEGKYTKIIFEI